MATRLRFVYIQSLLCIIFLVASDGDCALLDAEQKCQYNSSTVVELRRLIERLREIAPPTAVTAADRQELFIDSAPERFIPLFDEWMWHCWLKHVGYRASTAGHPSLLRIVVKPLYPTFRLDDVTTTLTPIPAGRLYMTVAWSHRPMEIMEALRSLGLQNPTDFQSLFRHITLGPLLSANLWRPQIELNVQEEQSTAIVFDLQRQPGRYFFYLNKMDEAIIFAHFGLYVAPTRIDSVGKSVETQKMMRANTLRISWCHFDSTLFPFDRTFCFLGFTVERPHGDTIAHDDRAKFSDRFPWAQASFLSYRSNISSVLVNLKTQQSSGRRHRSGVTSNQDRQVTSDDQEWLQAWRGLFCAYAPDGEDGEHDPSATDINCLTAFMLERKPTKYVYPWLVTINILAVSAIVSVYMGNGGYGIITSAMVPMGTFLFTLDSQVPNTADNYPIVGFYTLGMLFNTLLSMLVANIPFVLNKNGSSTVAVAMVETYQSSVKPGPPTKRWKTKRKKNLRQRLLVLFLVLHAGINAWALSQWLRLWSPPDFVPLAALGSRQSPQSVAAQLLLSQVESTTWTRLTQDMFSDYWQCTKDKCEAINVEQHAAVCNADPLGYC